MNLRLGLLPTLALVFVACGGNVVFERGSSGTGGGSTESSCERYCAQLADCPEVFPDCATSCEVERESYVQQGCGAEFDQFLKCYGDSPNVCAPTGEDCLGEIDAVSACVGGFDDGGSGN